MKPTFEQLSQLISYDPDTGEFRWKSTSLHRYSGEKPGTLNSDGYLVIGIMGKKIRAHHIAWMLQKREWPQFQIDHKNRIRSDNRFSNIREATTYQNNWNHPVRRNTKSGAKGVEEERRTGKWRARIRCRGKRYDLGSFSTISEAKNAYDAKALELFGNFCPISL